MTQEEIIAALHAAAGKRIRVTYDNGTVESVDVAAVDDEGFLHSGPDGIEPAMWWTRFISIRHVENSVARYPSV